MTQADDNRITSKRARYARRLIAYHEAGHAVIARKLGVEITSINMVASGNYQANVRLRNAAWVAQQAGGDPAALTRGLYADLMVALAGPAAQKLAGYPDSIRDEHDADSINVIGCAVRLARIEAGLPLQAGPDESELNDGAPLHAAGCAIVDRAWPETVALLQDNWSAVARVAGALQIRDHLTQAELDHIIANGQRKPK
jgi:hypothetical protein